MNRSIVTVAVDYTEIEKQHIFGTYENNSREQVT